MKHFTPILVAMLLLILAGVHAVVPQATTPAASSAQSVRDAEQRWLTAYYGIDAATLDGVEADTLTIITPSQSVDKQAHLTVVRKLAAASVPRNPSAVFSLSDQRIQVYGDVAVVSDVCHVTGVNPLTSPGRYYQTEVWHNERGAWKLVHFHISSLAHRM
jgi:ketosteroid isomerase-like protein